MSAELGKRVDALLALAGGIRVVDQLSLTTAKELLLAVKGLRKELSRTYGPVVEAAHKAHRNALAEKKRHDRPLLDAEGTVKAMVSEFIAEEQRRREKAAFMARQAELDRRKREAAAV